MRCRPIQPTARRRQVEEDNENEGGPVVGRRKYYPGKEIFEPVYRSLQRYLYRKRKRTWLKKLSLKNELQNAAQRDKDQMSRLAHPIFQRRSKSHS
jgi:hypothetical protein